MPCLCGCARPHLSYGMINAFPACMAGPLVLQVLQVCCILCVQGAESLQGAALLHQPTLSLAGELALPRARLQMKASRLLS